MAISEYASAFVRGGSTVVVLVAVAVVAVVTALLWKGVRSSSRTVELLTMAKVVALVLVPLVAFAVGQRAPAPLTATATSAITIGGIVLAMQSVIYSYDGWTGVLYFSGEVKNPARDIPRSMFGGLVSVSVIYLLLTGCFVYILGIGGVAADNFPAGQVARTIFGDGGSTILRIIVVISGLSAIPPIIMMASRVPYAMSGDGLFPRGAAVVNPGGTPTATLAVSALLTVGFIVTGTFSQVIAIAAFFFILQYVISFSAVFVLRRREPDRPRPYRAIGYPVTTAISWLGGVAFLIGAVVQDRRNSLIAIGLLVASYPVYRVLRLPRAVA
jgi:APA family basic amino acid/polyamine antiporter